MLNGRVGQLEVSWGVVGLSLTPLALLPFLPGQFMIFTLTCKSNT